MNKGQGAQVESVLIEDIQVFEDKSPVTSLKIYKNKKGMRNRDPA